MINGILNSAEREALLPEVALFLAYNPLRLTTVIPQAHFIRIPTDPRPDQYAYSVILYCEMSAWMENPALIIQLLNQWSHLPVFAEAINRINACIPPKFHIPPRVWDPILVKLNLPFLNRRITRDAIERFFYPLNSNVDPPGVRVLAVTGPSGSGKSFTYNYIHYIKSFLTNINFITVFIDLKMQATSRFDPMDLTRAILDQINPDWINQMVYIPPVTEEQRPRWYSQLCEVIAAQISITKTRCIIVLDGLDNKSNMQPIPAETLDMLAALANVATGEFPINPNDDLLRLVLLGYEQPLKNFQNRVRVEKIDPLKRNDIEKYFLDYARFYNKEQTIDAGGIDDMLDAVLDEDDIDSPDRTQKLAQRALTVAFGIINS